MKKTVLQISFITKSNMVISEIDTTDYEMSSESFIQWINHKQEQYREEHGEVVIISVNLIKFGYV